MTAGESLGTLGAVKRVARSVIPAALLLAASFGGFPAPAEEPAPVEQVAALLEGTFDSRAQAESDPKMFKAVRLVAVRVPKSRLGDGSPVLYVEQALLAEWIGAASYLGGLAAYAADADDGGSAALFFGITIASSVGGYYLGKRADTRTMQIRIVP